VAGAVENDLGLQVGQDAIKLGDLPRADQARDDAVPGAGEEQRRLVDLCALPRRRQLPVAIDVAIPVQPSAKAGLRGRIITARY